MHGHNLNSGTPAVMQQGHKTPLSRLACRLGSFLLACAMMSCLFSVSINAAEPAGKAVGQEHTYEEGVEGFYLSMGDPLSSRAANLIHSGRGYMKPDYTSTFDGSDPNDVTYLENVKQSIEWIIKANDLRQQHGKHRLKINSTAMAAAQIQAAYSSQSFDHSNLFGTDNLAWGLLNSLPEYGPSAGWYFEEKPLYDQGDMINSGHYQWLIEFDGIQYTGLGYRPVERTSSMFFVNDFSRFTPDQKINQQVLKDMDIYSLEDHVYYEKFMEYYDSVADGIQLPGKDYAVVHNGQWARKNGKWTLCRNGKPYSKGIVKFEDHFWLLDDDGSLRHGFYTAPSKDVYYFVSTGEAKTGWLKLDDEWYYFGEDAVMYDWQKTLDENGATYMFLKDGKMAAGEFVETAFGYSYFDQSGAMKKGWLQYEGHWYYFDEEGNMLRNTDRFGGHFNSQGMWNTWIF